MDDGTRLYCCCTIGSNYFLPFSKESGLSDMKTKQTAVSKATDWDIMMKTAFDKRNDVGNDEAAAPCAICMSGLDRKKEVSQSCSELLP